MMRRATARVLLVLAALLGLAGSGLAVLGSDWAARRARQELVRIIEARFEAQVEIEEASLTLLPRLSIDGRGLVLIRSGDQSRLPFVRIDTFRASGSALGVLRRSIDLVEIDGFHIDVARGADTGPPPRETPDLRIREIRVSNGMLRILPDDLGKLPLHFPLKTVRFYDFSFEHAGQYSAVLINPKPEGLITSVGLFGPWNAESPRSTPLSGDYQFSEAKLSTITGIGGTLSSTGTFSGVLGRISVTGTTKTPDFMLDIAKQPLRLDTRFRAVVDGTTGDTSLEEVDATLGDSHITASGLVASTRGAEGRTVSLAVKADGRFEDFLRLAVRAPEPPMRGAIALTTSFTLPPGEADVVRRMCLKGNFNIRKGRFSSNTVQQRIDELSRRGRGEPRNSDIEGVAATFGSVFVLCRGELDLSRFQFAVNGARVALAGDYGLRDQQLDFSGDLILDAPLSRTTTGFKSLLLRAVDPLFRRRGVGTVLPIAVTGTVEKPSFGLDKGRIIGR